MFLRFNNDAARLVTIQATGAANGGGTFAATDPDIFVLRRGVLAAFGAGDAAAAKRSRRLRSLPGCTSSRCTISRSTVVGNAPRCMTVSVTGS